MNKVIIRVQAYFLVLLITVASSAAVAFPVMLALGILHLNMAAGIPALSYVETFTCVLALSVLSVVLRKEPEVKISR